MMNPFAAAEFRLERVKRMLRLLRQRSCVRIRKVDTAGWTRKMLSKTYRQASNTKRSFRNIFGSEKRRGGFSEEARIVLLLQENVSSTFTHMRETIR
jgi:hypothetical protein